MTKRRLVFFAALGVSAFLVSATLIAGNMMFRLDLALQGPGTNLSGTNLISLPFHQQTDLIDAEDLLADIGPAAVSVQAFVRSNDGILTYDGYSGSPFALAPGEALLVQVNTDVNYIMVGTHDPSLNVTLLGPGAASVSGINYFARPIHSTTDTADDLLSEVNAAAGNTVVVGVGKFVGTSDALEFYPAGSDFSLVPGEGYVIQVSSDVTWVPAHY